MSQNPPINPDIYQPKNFVVTDIVSSDQQTVVTTEEDYDYVLGQLVRFHVPIPYGMRQIDGLSGYVTLLNSSRDFTCDIDSSSFDSFQPSPLYPGNTSPQVSAIGDRNLNTSGTTISGAFQQTT